MATALPRKLKKEPLIDAVFELRFSSKAPASVIFPGLLFSMLDGDKVIESLPLAQLPKAVRDADPDLKFAPVSRVDWGQFFISISDFSVSVSCKYPYPGWINFKPAIVEVMDILAKSNFIETVERYSMKYVDLLQVYDDREKVAMINGGLSIAGHTLEKEPFMLRLEIPRDGFINAVQIASSARVELHNGIKMEGLIVDVDSIATQNASSIESTLENFQDKLESIHQTNKAMFFDCLTPQSVNSLEPIYE